MSRDFYHTCAARGCGRTIVKRYVMCRPCWRKVPWPIQQRIYRAYSPAVMRGKGSAEWVAALRLAVSAVDAANRQGDLFPASAAVSL